MQKLIQSGIGVTVPNVQIEGYIHIEWALLCTGPYIGQMQRIKDF